MLGVYFMCGGFFLLQVKWAKFCGVPFQAPHQIAHFNRINVPCDPCGSFCGEVGKFSCICMTSVFFRQRGQTLVFFSTKKKDEW